uniref:G-protein coupled receptors family 1 profile domain-containing protein n=1 Tax=Tetranychus urticae TaxID=32264 RepID=T1L0B5_TETUR
MSPNELMPFNCNATTLTTTSTPLGAISVPLSPSNTVFSDWNLLPSSVSPSPSFISSTVFSSSLPSPSPTSSLELSGNEIISPQFPYYMRTSATLFCALILILGTTGNILVPIVVCRTKELRNSTNIFLINLSLADLFVLIVCMPTVLIELHSKPEIWLLGQEMCKAVPFVEMVVAHGSILTMMAISFERYYAICKPLKAGYKCTRLRAVIIILSVWAIAIISTIPILWIAELSHETYIDGSLVPVCLTQANKLWHKLYFIGTMIAFFWSPLLILIIIYIVITKRLFLNDENIRTSTNHGNHECGQMRARRQVVYMLATVIACFFICLLPFRLFTLWLLLSSTDQVKSLGMELYYTTLYFCRIMLYLNSALNPILYNLISSKFRDAFLAAVCCQKTKRLLLRQNTFNTTTSSMLMSSLKNAQSPMLNNRKEQNIKEKTKKVEPDLLVKDCPIDLIFQNLKKSSAESYQEITYSSH